jgi:hypothetical protein
MTACTVDTLTLSSQQKVLAEERIKAAGFAGRIRVWLLDYRKWVSLSLNWLELTAIACHKAGRERSTVWYRSRCSKLLGTSGSNWCVEY